MYGLFLIRSDLDQIKPDQIFGRSDQASRSRRSMLARRGPNLPRSSDLTDLIPRFQGRPDNPGQAWQYRLRLSRSDHTLQAWAENGVPG